MKIDWIGRQHLKLPGQLGLTHSPGSRRAATGDDLDCLAQQAVAHIVCLQEAHEFEAFLPPETLATRTQAVVARGIRFSHRPIVDMRAPSTERMEEIVALILPELSAGRRVIVHCWAGLGRSGTVAACVLVANGLRASDAIEIVRFYRPGAIQSVAQEDLVCRYEQTIASS